MAVNAAGIEVSGSSNPNWKGGLIQKFCLVCGSEYSVKRVNANSRYCSLQCVGVSQRGKRVVENPKISIKECVVCKGSFSVPLSHESRYHCCSKDCSHRRRASIMSGEGNPNWAGGVSRLPYPWNFSQISKEIIKRDSYKCQNPECDGKDIRLTTHHINYDKADCTHENLIALCSACNSKANFGREKWMNFYRLLMQRRSGGWEMEEF